MEASVARAIGIGLVGCGMIGQIHADGLAKLADDGEIGAVAAADLSAAGLAAVEPELPFERLTDDPTAVIAIPTSTR